MRIKKKLALLLASALLVTSINVMPVEASTSNQATGSENDNAVANTDLTLSIAALNSNQGNTVTSATGNTVLSLSVEALGENQGNTVKNATGSTNLTLQVEALKANQGNAIKSATGSTRLTLVIVDHNWIYKANGNTIMAYCNANDGCQYNGDSKAVSLTLSAADTDYSGNAYTGANVTDGITSVTDAVVGNITYYLSDGSTPTSSANSGAESDGEAPKNAGSYVAKVVLTAGSNTYTAVKAFQIDPKSLVASASVKNRTYDGTTAAEVTATVDTGITGQTLTITGLTGTFDNKNAGTRKRVTINSTNAQVTAGADTDAANYSITYPTTATGNITAKTLNAVVSAANKVYDGTTDAEVTATVETGIGEETLTITGLTGSFADQNVGTDKNVSIDSTRASVQAGAGTSADNYTVVYSAASTASITARPVTLTWSSADLTYTGSEQEVTAEVSNKASGADSFTITYTNNKKTAVGEYTATVTDLDNSNYTLTGAEGITKNWSISYLVTAAKAGPSGDTKNDSGWYTDDVTLTPGDGYQISGDGENWDDSIKVTEDGEKEVTYYLKDREGHITDKKTITIKKDSTAPGGEIKAGENSFTKFLNTVTFGYFFKNTVDVEISGTDETSGIAKIEYQKVAKGETYNADGTWTTGTSFSMTANDKSLIYARITDVAGNTVIINSEGIVVYTDATTSDSVEYTRTTKTDVTSAIELKGNTVEEIRKGNTVLMEGTDYEIQDGKIVLKGEYLEKFPVGDYNLTVTYNPYGENFDENAHGAAATDSTIHLTVKRAGSEDADTKITNKDSLSKEYNGQPTEEAAPSSKNGSTPKVEYKKKGDPDSSYTEEVPKDAGDYVVRVTYPQDENYEETSVTEEFTISPKAVTAVVSVSTKTYNGTTDAEVTSTVDTGITGQTLTITGLAGTFDNKNAGTGKTVTINSTNAQVTAGADTDASNYSIIYPATATGNITAKTLNAVVSAANKEYDGTTDAEVTATVETEIGEETLTITGLTGSFKDQNVEKDKNVSIDSTGASVQAGAGTSAYNYTVVYPAASTASITARPVTLTWSRADLTYTGSEQEVTAEVSNKASGADSFTITYTNNKKTAVGEYTATVTDLGNSNYTLTGAKGNKKNWSISYLVTDAKAAPSGDTRNDSGWFTGTVTLTPGSEYRISKDGTAWSDTLTVIDDGESTVTYYLKDPNGSITDQKTVTIKKDSTAPGGEIKAGENSFTKFLNTITFGYFFKNTVDVEISGTDATSGIAKIEYQKVAKGETYNADGTWTAGKSFSMTANDKSVIYARITDVAGNTVIINSKGIVVYTDATTSDSVEYTRTTKTDVTSAIELKGNTVEEIRNGNTVLTEGTDYEIKDSRIVLKGEYLEKLSVGDYCLSVSYNPYGEVYGEDAHGIKVADSTIKVTVKRADSESADTKITNKDKLSKEYDGQQTEAAAPSSKNGSTPKVEYKKKGNPDSSFTEEVPKDAGNYVVRVTYPQDENYEETSVTEEFTISPKAVTAVVSVSTKIYNGTTDAEVTATVDTGITGQKLAITGLTGTFDNKNAGTGKTVTINSTNAQVTAGAGTKASNYRITYPAESTGSIQAASLTIKVNDASKHIGKADPAFGYSVITGILVEGDSISGIIFTRTAGETAGTYDITATEKVGSNPNYNITITDGTLTIEDHTLVTDAAIAATCTETGLTAGKHCSVCNEVLVAQEEVAAKGHTEVVDEAVEATCTETGLTEGKHCSVCNEVLVAQKEVAAKGHTEVVDEAVEATCTETGLTEGKHCSVCNEVLVAQKEVAAKGHTEVVDEAVAATCTETGLTEGKHCSVCNEVLVA